MGNYTYTNDYDPIGNRLQSTVNSGQLSVTNIYISNNLNQYSSILNSQFSIPYSLSHDEDGNMTWNGRKTLSYDAENRLSSAAPNYWGITNGATRTDYIYDYMNRRISKTTSVMSGRTIGFPPSPLDPQGTWSELETRKFIYDGWNVIAELVSTNTSSFSPHSSSFYVWGLDLSGTVQGAGGVGGLLSETKTTDSSSNTYFVYSDANGNITEYIDHEGIVKAHYEYNAFGEATYKSGTMKDDFAFRFSSKYFDPETGFYYYGERYYDPILDRWLSRDPITEDGGLNLYAHTQNNPVNRVDTDGRASYPTWGQTPLKTQIINNHYEKLRKKLINELKGLCPKNKVDEWEHPLKTTGSKYTKKYTLCCNRSDCLKEATSIANSYIGAIKAAWLAEHKKHFIVKGHYPGNFRARGGCSICAGEGADDWMCGDGLVCGGWASLGHSAITQLPAYKKSHCWVSELKIKYFWFTKKPRHTFVILHAPEGTQKLDPWAWGGWYY